MPAKAKLTTRERTTSNVSSDNFNKGSELSFAEADSNFINLRDQTIAISDGSTSTDIEAGETITFSGASVSGNTVTITSGSSSSGGNLGDLQVNGTTLSPVSTNANLELDAHGTGSLRIKPDQIIFGTNPAGSSDAIITTPSGSGEDIMMTCEEGSNSGTIKIQSGADQNILITPNGSGYVHTRNLSNETTPAILGNITITQNTIKTTRSNEDIEINPNGSGAVKISDAYKLPTADGSANQVLQTNGSGVLSFATISSGGSVGDLTITGSTISSPSNGDLTLDPSGTGDIILRVDGSTPSKVKVGNGTEYGSITSNGDTQLEVSANGGGGTQARITLQSTSNGRHVDLQPGTSGKVRLFGVLAGESDSTAMNLNGVSILGNTISSNASNADLEIDASGTGALAVLTQKVMMTNLPTSNPGVAGQLYNDSGTMKISAG